MQARLGATVLIAIATLGGCGFSHVSLPATPDVSFAHAGKSCDQLQSDFAAYEQSLADRRKRADEAYRLRKIEEAKERAQKQNKTRLRPSWMEKSRLRPEERSRAKRRSRALDAAPPSRTLLFPPPPSTVSITVGQRILVGQAARRIGSGDGDRLGRAMLRAMIPFGGLTDIRTSRRGKRYNTIVEAMYRRNCDNIPQSRFANTDHILLSGPKEPRREK